MKEKSGQKYDFRISLASARSPRELWNVNQVTELVHHESRDRAFCTPKSVTQELTLFQEKWIISK